MDTFLKMLHQQQFSTQAKTLATTLMATQTTTSTYGQPEHSIASVKQVVIIITQTSQRSD
jgi:hypothetical protein